MYIKDSAAINTLRLDFVRPRYALAVLSVFGAIYLGVLWPWMLRWDAAALLVAAAGRRQTKLRLQAAQHRL